MGRFKGLFCILRRKKKKEKGFQDFQMVNLIFTVAVFAAIFDNSPERMYGLENRAGCEGVIKEGVLRKYVFETAAAYLFLFSTFTGEEGRGPLLSKLGILFLMVSAGSVILLMIQLQSCGSETAVAAAFYVRFALWAFLFPAYPISLVWLRSRQRPPLLG